MTTKIIEKLLNDYIELLNDEEDFNVIINVGKIPDVKTFKTHSAILRYRSLYFRNELANINKDKNNIKTINLNHVSIQQFDIIIKYIYGGVILLDNLDMSFIFELMLFACEFFLEELAKYIEAYLIETKAHWLRLHFARVYQESFKSNILQELQKWCNDIVVKYPNKIFDSEDFTLLHENALVSLVGRDDLQMEEIMIWNYVIKWGIAQNPDLPTDSKDWTNENFLSLKTTLQNCLPLIRYFQISGNDIYDHVHPYKKILEKTLWKDVKMRLISPNKPVSSKILPSRIILTKKLPTRTTEPFSTVINEVHAAEIASWIDNRADKYSTENSPYEFKLLLRGSRDGFTRDTFWNLCHKRTNVVVIMKVKGTDEILGGYNPIGWEKPNSGVINKCCNDSFIFSLKNGAIQNSILSRVKDPTKGVIYNNSSYGKAYKFKSDSRTK
ncbi:hypothetical protein C2G38_2041395 [Gigaspora rosea]|uniref:TLD-domain-containing protein n=1 Tax=Gigaspora rosea TaxID=44941 RepID=A0A397UW53_9GLOM|nr:hypothetical protein C2G38_2041395 [Gigaspora rosea]